MQRQGADHRVHQRREPGAGLAVGAERQAPPYCRPPQQSLGEIVVERNLGPVDEGDVREVVPYRDEPPIGTLVTRPVMRYSQTLSPLR